MQQFTCKSYNNDCTNGRLIKNWKYQVRPEYSTARCTFTCGHILCHDSVTRLDIFFFFQKSDYLFLEVILLKLKALVKLHYNCLQSQITFYVTTSLKEAESLWWCKFLSYKIFPMFWQSKGSFHISSITLHIIISRLQNICRQITICVMCVNLYVIPYNFLPICSTILARRAKNVTSYICTTI
jgi:hypothetical protein